MLTATVSHEMKTPLNSIITPLNLIGKYISGVKGKKMLSVIKSSA